MCSCANKSPNAFNQQNRQWLGNSMNPTSKKAIKKDGLSSLHALLPGAKINASKGTILVNIGTSKETLIFNIGGTKFETYRSTLYKIPRSPLADENFLKKHFREDKGDYFFDRDPDVFKVKYFLNGIKISSPFRGPCALKLGTRHILYYIFAIDAYSLCAF